MKSTLLDNRRLEYWVNGQLKEVVLHNHPKAICHWMREKLKNTTHKAGHLVVARVK